MAVTTYGADGSVSTSPSPTQNTTSIPSSGSSVANRLASLGSAYNTAMSNYSQTGDRSYLDAASGYHQTANLLRSQNGMQTVFDSNTDHPGTGTTGSTSGSIAGQMLQAAQNPSYSGQMTHWNVGGTTFDTPVGDKNTSYNGRSITSMANLASSLGINYTKDPSTGAITVNGKTVNPVGYDSSGSPIVQVRQVLTAMGVTDQNIQFDQKSGNVSVTMPTKNPMQEVQVPNYMSGLPQMPGSPQLQPFQAPDLSTYYQNLMPMQQTFTPNWTQYYQQAQNQTNPLVQNQINMLTTKQGQDITKLDEGMNAKGIFNSGLAVQAENQIRANTNDQVAKVLMTQQANIAKAAQQLYQDAFDQWSKGNTMAIQNNQMWLNQAMNQEKQAFAQWAQTQNLTMDQYKYALDAWDKMATLSQNNAKMQMQAQQDNNTNAMDWFKQNNLSAFQQQDLNQRMQQAMLPYEFQTMNSKATNALDLFKFNNLSAQQKAQDTLDQSKLNETITHDRQLESIDWANAQTNRGRLNEEINNNITKAKEFAATMKNSQLKEQVSGLADQMKQSNANLTELNKQKTTIMTNLASATDQQRAFYQSQLDDVNTKIATEMANVKNAQDGINQRLQLDSSSQFANEPGPTTQDVGNDLPGFQPIQ